jgi:hypothetical protein
LFVVAGATEDVFQVLQQAHTRSEDLSIAEIVDALDGAQDEHEVMTALEHLRDEGVVREPFVGRWCLRGE